METVELSQIIFTCTNEDCVSYDAEQSLFYNGEIYCPDCSIEITDVTPVTE